jgi:hypothetical protein
MVFAQPRLPQYQVIGGGQKHPALACRCLRQTPSDRRVGSPLFAAWNGKSCRAAHVLAIPQGIAICSRLDCLGFAG